MPYLLKCDGACQPNPGPGSIGVALFDDAGDVVATISRALTADETNNSAEYHAAIAAFTLARERGIARPDVRTDSRLVVEQGCGRWVVREPTLLDLNKRLQHALRVTGGTLTWIPREENTVADALSKRALMPSIFPAAPESVIAEATRALLHLGREPELARVTRIVLETVAERPEEASDALAALRLGRGHTSTMIADVARFTAGLLHGPETVAAMEAAIAERSEATRLKGLRWAARGLAPALVVGKLRIEKAATTAYRIKAGGT